MFNVLILVVSFWYFMECEFCEEKQYSYYFFIKFNISFCFEDDENFYSLRLVLKRMLCVIIFDIDLCINFLIQIYI